MHMFFPLYSRSCPFFSYFSPDDVSHYFILPRLLFWFWNTKWISFPYSREVCKCQVLIVWTDCDREGENILLLRQSSRSKLKHSNHDGEVEFIWARLRLFHRLASTVLHETCVENPLAAVVNQTSKPKSKFRSLPLDTVELEKLASRKLRISANETIRVAEKLYNQGIIGYPRT